MLLAYRFTLDPTPRQARELASHAGAARVAFNWGLARVTANLDQRTAERTYGIPDADLTPSLNWTLAGLRRDWNAVKDDVAPWWRECSKEAFNTGLDSLARALQQWSASRNGTRKGPPVGFPRFRSRRRTTPKIRFTTGAIRCETTHAVLPRIGRVKISERGPRGGRSGDLTRAVAAGSARILGVSVRFERGRWYVSFTVERAVTRASAAEPHAVVGVDLGVKVLATLSTGHVIANPRHLAVAATKVRRLSRTVARRRGPDRRIRTEASARWRRAAGALAKAQGRVADRRRNALHQTTTALTARYGTLVVEDLAVAGMTRSARGSLAAPGRNVAAKAGLNRAIADAGFAEFRRQVEYKSAWRGGRVIVADRWYPSSKVCSGCGTVRAKLSLSERMYSCPACGLRVDRDVNAAVNLAGYGRRVLAAEQAEEESEEQVVAASGAETLNGRGADQRTAFARRVAVKRQPGTAAFVVVGQTGTPVPQGAGA